VDNGNLRATWKDEKGNHVGLQFLGNRFIQYVIFHHRSTGQVSRVAGCDSENGVRRQLQALDLQHLVSA